MKLFLLLIPVSFLLGACAPDGHLIKQVPAKFERGIRGDGQLYEPNRNDDPFVDGAVMSGT